MATIKGGSWTQNSGSMGTTTKTSDAGLGPLSAGLQIGGMALGGMGAMERNRDNKSYIKNLDYFKRQNINPLLAPLQESLYGGLAPGGYLRNQLAAEGTQESLQQSRNALAQARAGGTRTSARAQELSGLANILRTMGALQAQNAAGITADQTVAGMRINAMGAADALQPSQNQFNRYQSWGAGLGGLGQALGAYNQYESSNRVK